MEQIILQLNNIVKDYTVAGEKVRALHGVSLQFRRKEFVSVLGPSGCGKTTLLNIIGGLDHYTDGDLIIKGVSTKDYHDRDWDIYRNHSIGFVFQSYNLIPHQTVLSNVELALTVSGISSGERKARAKEALERVGLGGQLYKKPNQLSGGQMQRVAIARALVNNPEILLADEPTGALDTETSVQIMDLIKEIAGERLVIMVTHNPDLANQYSTRIVQLLDGQVVGDSNPITGDTEYVTEDAPALAERGGTAAAAETSGVRVSKKRNKTSMGYFTAFALSGRNLLTKKGRTAVTSIAGSIGIISVCLVLALSNGFSSYITQTEADMLSYYPVTIDETTLDYTSALSNFTGSGESVDMSRLDDRLYVNSFLTQLARGMTTSNDLSDSNYYYDESGDTVTIRDYLEMMPDDLYYALAYDYGETFSDSLFTTMTVGSDVTGIPETEMHMSLDAVKEYYTTLLTSMGDDMASLAVYVDYFSDVVSIMPGTSSFTDESYSDYVLSQYDIVAGSFPTEENQAVLVVSGDNTMTDLTLAQLGFMDEDVFLSLFTSDGGTGGDISIPFYDETDEDGNVTEQGIIGRTFSLYNGDGLYREDTEGVSGYKYTYTGYMTTEEAETYFDESSGIEIEIVGILELKEDMTYGCLSSGLNLTEATITKYIAQNMESDIITYLESDDFDSVDTLAGEISVSKWIAATLAGYGDVFTQYADSTYYSSMYSSSTYYTADSLIRVMGGSDVPSSVSIYARDFDTKDDMLEYLDGWNDIVSEARLNAVYYSDGDTDNSDTYEGPTEITYSDTVGTLMTMMNVILNAITYVLVAFTCISLVVSTVMIGVITYVSVVERTKEIGILRSIGARKKDIRRVFNAESFIIGLCAGLIGIIFAYIFQVIINAILKPLTGIAGLASLRILHALIMLLVSVVLTLISGLVPANAAANRDPVVALRSE